MSETVFSIIHHKGLSRGFVVQSMAGHDRLKPYLVIRAEGGFVYLADGGLRRLEKPKKKRASHVRPLGMLNDLNAMDEAESLGDSGQKNSAIRRLLAEFINDKRSEEET
jgi:large subunit ribosomal protein L14e